LQARPSVRRATWFTARNTRRAAEGFALDTSDIVAGSTPAHRLSLANAESLRVGLFFVFAARENAPGRLVGRDQPCSRRS
jgi:hypothetical protein